jgi:hypothetical protein
MSRSLKGRNCVQHTLLIFYDGGSEIAQKKQDRQVRTGSHNWKKSFFHAELELERLATRLQKSETPPEYDQPGLQTH